MNNSPIRIILVDDHVLIRKSWKMLLQKYPAFQVVGDCGSGQEAIELTLQVLPDIMLLDINMFPMGGYEVAEKIGEILPSVKIIGLSVNNKPKHAVKLVELGARGYLTKTSTMDEICQGILEVQEGNFYICEEIIKSISAGEPMTGKFRNSN